jgi:hypothetical protein
VTFTFGHPRRLSSLGHTQGLWIADHSASTQDSISHKQAHSPLLFRQGYLLSFQLCTEDLLSLYGYPKLGMERLTMLELIVASGLCSVTSAHQFNNCGWVIQPPGRVKRHSTRDSGDLRIPSWGLLDFSDRSGLSCFTGGWFVHIQKLLCYGDS